MHGIMMLKVEEEGRVDGEGKSCSKPEDPLSVDWGFWV